MLKSYDFIYVIDVEFLTKFSTKNPKEKQNFTELMKSAEPINLFLEFLLG